MRVHIDGVRIVLVSYLIWEKNYTIGNMGKKGILMSVK